MSSHIIVKKSNDLIMAKYKLSLEEQRLVLYLTSLIHMDDMDFKEYEITVEEFCEFSGFPKDHFYQYFRKMCDSLLQKRIDIYADKDIIHLCWLAQSRYSPHKGKVTVSFAPALKPYLLQLQSNFTTYELENIKLLRSVYSIRLYEILKRYKNLHQKIFMLDELKRILCLENKYALYADFKKYVILVAQKELEKKCDIRFEFREIKDSRKVEKIEFLIYENSKDNPNIIDSTCTVVPTPQLIEDRQSTPVFNQRKDQLNLSPNQLEILDQLKFIDEDIPDKARLAIYKDAGGDIERIRRRYEVMKERDADNVTAWMRWAVREPDTNFRDTPNARKTPKKNSDGEPKNQPKNRFINFNQRKNDYAELERLEQEQFIREMQSDKPKT